MAQKATDSGRAGGRGDDAKTSSTEETARTRSKQHAQIGKALIELAALIANGIREEKVYHFLDETDSKVLYAILKLQHDFVALQSAKGLPLTSQRALAGTLGVDNSTINRTISRLVDGRYLISATVSSRTAMGEVGGQSIYEVHTKTCITNRDTATMLLALLAFAQKQRTTDKTDEEGKVSIDDFIKSLDIKDGVEPPLKYLTTSDIVGEDGKINELARAAEYLERVSSKYIRPRLKLLLERLYLKLVSSQVSLKQLKSMRYSLEADQWIQKDATDVHADTD